MVCDAACSISMLKWIVWSQLLPFLLQRSEAMAEVPSAMPAKWSPGHWALLQTVFKPHDCAVQGTLSWSRRSSSTASLPTQRTRSLTAPLVRSFLGAKLHMCLT